MARGGIADYVTRRPGPDDVALVVEVTRTSVAKDRALARVYGKGKNRSARPGASHDGTRSGSAPLSGNIPRPGSESVSDPVADPEDRG